ncbi:MAG: DUF4386 domain-containing protein [Rhodococcus sp. (in: high G+C Gram-positive bacteria)]|uniref:DUF4386 domain-containing protein n=1 Tax=Rhodococcus sp. TaxID=1831 RepID=UPI003BB79F02
MTTNTAIPPRLVGHARAAGILYLVTHVTSVVAVALYAPLREQPGSVAAGGGPAVTVAGLLDVVLALAVVGTSIALYPIVRRTAESLAVGYVALRTLEAGVILVGVVAGLAVLTLDVTAATALPGAPDSAAGAAQSAAAVHGWTFLVGPGLICPVNTLVLAFALRRSGLVPRWITTLGLVGAPLVFALNIAVAVTDRGFYPMSTVAAEYPVLGILVAPIFLWEISLAVYLLAWSGRDRGNLTRRPASIPGSDRQRRTQVESPV